MRRMWRALVATLVIAAVSIMTIVSVPLTAPALAATGVGIISTLAGIGVSGFSGDGGPANKAQLNAPHGTAIDRDGNVYIADHFNHRIRRVDAATKTISTVAGNGVAGFSGDGGPATDAQLDHPYPVAVDRDGNLYIVDLGNNRIRKVDATSKVITTVAGNGVKGYSGDGGPANEAALNGPHNVAIDEDGNLFISDRFNNRIRKVDATSKVITTVVGTGIADYTGDGGLATQARLYYPYSAAIDGSNNMYIADTYNNVVRKVDATTKTITTVVGTGAQGFSGDGGPAINATMKSPTGIAVEPNGNLYIADHWNRRVRKVNASGQIITTVAGNGVVGYGGDGGPATEAKMNTPFNVAVDGIGNIYVADYSDHRVRKVTFNTSPTVAVTGVTAENGYAKGSVPQAMCQVADLEDGNSSFSASLSPVSGPNAADGIGRQTASCAYTDHGGLSATSQVAYSIIDAAPPVVTYALNPETPDGTNGWWKSDVSLVWNVSDPESPNSVVKTDCNDQRVVTDQAETTYVCSAASAGGLATPMSVAIKRDATPPTLNPSMPATVLLHSDAPAVTPNASDNLSGILDGSVSCSNVDTSTVGTRAVTCVATDNAGNIGTRTVNYQVAYEWDGFLQPINDTAHHVELNTSVFKGGSTVPVKFQPKDANGNVIQASTAPIWFTPSVGNETNAPVDESVYTDPADSGATFRWDSTFQQYVYYWSTKSAAVGHYYRIGVQLDDGQTYYVNIGLR